MNTPKTKSPKRWKLSTTDLPTGSFNMALTDARFLHALGTIASTWPHVEEMMMDIFATLLNVDSHQASVRQLYYSIVNTQIRIQIMVNLLESSPINISKGPEYDEAIEEYKALNAIRNKLVHGLWSTHEDGRVYLTSSNMDFLFFAKDTREVKFKEIEDVINRISDFIKKTRNIIARDTFAKLGAPWPPAEAVTLTEKAK